MLKVKLKSISDKLKTKALAESSYECFPRIETKKSLLRLATKAKTVRGGFYV
jgi:hypothetical protein